MKSEAKNILVIGATSAMAMETCKNFAANNCNFYLVSRSHENLMSISTDLVARGAKKVECASIDSADYKTKPILEDSIKAIGEIDLLLVAHGTLGDQEQDEKDAAKAEETIQINFISAVHILTNVANYFEARKSGSICVISSVAGDRGRPSNYIYGCAKAGLSSFLQGLRARLAKSNVSVTTIKPGFVSSPMTAHLDQGPLFATSKKVGRGIYRAIQKQKDVAYLPSFWFFIMMIVIHIPERIFKKLNL